MQLRPYQTEAVNAVWGHLRTRPDNPLVVIPTGGGKTPILANLCRDAVTRWGGRVLVLAHVKELLAQAADKLAMVCPEVEVGVYSAGLDRRDTEAPVIVAGIQSVHRRATELGAFNLVVVDEAHLIPPDGDGMYRRFLADALEINPRLRVVGLTATPYRTSSGMIVGPDSILNDICYEVGVRELIDDGYLSPLVCKAGIERPDFERLHIRGGEFALGETEAMMGDAKLVAAAVDEIATYTQDRQACLIFATGIAHAEQIVKAMEERHDLECGFVCGDTPAAERDEILGRFQDGRLKYLANVAVLTTGFDAPRVDCVALLRPTMSPGLYYQMVGRGFRLSPDKVNCLVLDFGGNALRHGPIDAMTTEAVETRRRKGGKRKPRAKECPDCREVLPLGTRSCGCGFAFPEPQRRKHEQRAASAGILSGDWDYQTHVVAETRYSLHAKQGAKPDAPRTLRVSYRVDGGRWLNEFICLEHKGYPRHRAVGWWLQRSSEPTPKRIEDALAAAQAGGLAEASEITTRKAPDSKWPEIFKAELGPIPQVTR